MSGMKWLRYVPQQDSS